MKAIINSIPLAFFGLLLSLVLSSCDSTSKMMKYQESFISIYIETDYLDGPLKEDDGSHSFYFEVGGKHISYGSPEHKALSEKYGDTHYNRLADIFKAALSRPLLSVDTEALDDYDEAHPAGSSHNDIAILHYATCEPFVASGYTTEYGFTREEYRLSEMPAGEKILLGWSFGLRLDREPSTIEEHKVRVTFSFEGDRKLTQTFTVKAKQQ